MKRLMIFLIIGVLILTVSGMVLAGDKVKISLLQPSSKIDYQRAVDIANEYMEDHPNVEIEIIGVGWGDAYSKIMTMVAAGNAPDIIYIATRWLPVLVQMGAVEPLEDYVTQEKKDMYFESLLRGVHYQGKLYAIPRAFSTKALIYRTDLIPEPPKTWDELVTIAKKVQAENEDIYGFGIAGAKHVSTTSQFFNYLFQSGGDVFDEEGNILLNTPQSIKALKFYVDLHREHKVVPNPIEYNREELPVLFKTGKIAMFVCGPWAKPTIGLDPDNDQVPYASAPLPKGRYNATILVSDSFLLSASSKNKKVAWEYIDWATSLENQMKFDLASGLVPTMYEEVRDPAFTENPYFKTYVDMIPYGQPQPLPLVWEPFQDIVNIAIQKALLGKVSPAEALDEAVNQIKEQNLAPFKQ